MAATKVCSCGLPMVLERTVWLCIVHCDAPLVGHQSKGCPRCTRAMPAAR